MEQVLLNRLTEVAQQQAATAQQQAVSSERLVGLLERMDSAIERAEEERQHQHSETRSHMDTVGKSMAAVVMQDASNRDGWWKKMAALIAIVQLVNVLVNFFKH